jgi:hypothetical protein
VLLQGKEKLMVTAGGAAIEIAGGNITLTASGAVALKAGQRDFTSAKSTTTSASLPVPSELHLQPVEAPHSLRFAAIGADELLAHGWASLPFAIVDDEGVTLAQGTVAEDGRLPRITSALAKEVTLRLGDTHGAQLIPRPKSIAPPTNALPILEPEGDDPEELNAHEEELEHAMSKVTSSRYYQEIVSATTHHSSEFLSTSQIRELLDEADR